MRGFLIAVSCGLAAAAALLLTWYGGGEPKTTTLPAPVAPVPASAATAALSSQPPPPPQALPAEPAAPQPVVAPWAAPTVAAPVVQAAPAQGASAVHSVFALSSDHRTLIQGASMAAADLDRLQSEPRDDAWAAETERLIRRELARHASAADFDIIAVDCRQTLCAIQAFGNGEDGHRRWIAAVDELYQDALANAFDSVNTAFPTLGGNRAPVLTFLHRKPVAPQR